MALILYQKSNATHKTLSIHVNEKLTSVIWIFHIAYDSFKTRHRKNSTWLFLEHNNCALILVRHVHFKKTWSKIQILTDIHVRMRRNSVLRCDANYRPFTSNLQKMTADLLHCNVTVSVHWQIILAPEWNPTYVTTWTEKQGKPQRGFCCHWIIPPSV